MTKKKLAALLQSGAITQEEHDELVKTATDDVPEPAAAPPETTASKPESPPLPGIEKLVEAAVARATGKMAAENQRLTSQLEKIKREKLTDEEAKRMELEEKDQQLREREAALLDKERREYAIKAIKQAGLDDGSDRALELVDFVLAGDEAGIDGRVKAFAELFQRAVRAEVDKTFRASGRTPQAGSASNGAVNPYAKDTWNFTAQNELELRDPQEAKRLRELAQ